MKIVFVFHDAEVYGAPKSLLDLIDGLLEKHSHIYCYAILPYQGPLVHEIEKRKLPYKIIPYPRWVHKKSPKVSFYWRTIADLLRNNKFVRAAKTLGGAYQISKILKTWQINVVYSNTSVIAAGAIAALIAKKKHVWHIREFLGIELFPDWRYVLFTFLQNKTKLVIFTSLVLRDYYAQLISKPQKWVVYNGVMNKNSFDFWKRNNKAINQPFTFCMVGLITSGKGQHEAIKALAILKEQGIYAQLMIAGKGDIESISLLIRKLDVSEQVTLLGHIADPFREVYANANACLMCSQHEAFGRVTIEAMACSLPVIGKKTNYSGTVELIQDGNTGLLYEGDEKALAEKMKELVSNPAKGEKLGEQAWLYAKEHFNREQYVNRIYDLLMSI